jgi:hypothetical protein
MLGSIEPGVSLAATADVSLVPGAGATGAPFATHDSYPAPEAHVFTYREGGFYGSLFTTSRPADQYVCASEIWKLSDAELTDRRCAGGLASTHGCFANVPGQCDAPSTAPCTPASATAGSKVYDACPSPARSWDRPYTTYLNHPCDLFATDDECFPFLVSDVLKSSARRPRPERHRAVDQPRDERRAVPGAERGR